MRNKFLVFALAALVLCLAVNAGEAAVFSLRDGQVYKDGETVGCNVYEVPPDLNNGIKTWAALSEMSDVSGGGEVTEAEAGLWFFGGEGEFMGFVPNDSVYGYADILWSPSGDRFALIYGSGMRADLFCDIYVNMKKWAEFAVQRGCEGEWLGDGMRFVSTRIDDTRENGSPSQGTGFGVKLSVVLYDSPIDEMTVVKEATDTQNFAFAGISGDDIVISENYVKSPDDWADDEKVEMRKIKVPVPAAG
jgi:hypothetical protein